jgi:hypothetical protein
MYFCKTSFVGGHMSRTLLIQGRLHKTKKHTVCPYNARATGGRAPRAHVTIMHSRRARRLNSHSGFL